MIEPGSLVVGVEKRQTGVAVTPFARSAVGPFGFWRVALLRGLAQGDARSDVLGTAFVESGDAFCVRSRGNLGHRFCSTCRIIARLAGAALEFDDNGRGGDGPRLGTGGFPSDAARLHIELSGGAFVDDAPLFSIAVRCAKLVTSFAVFGSTALLPGIDGLQAQCLED